MLGLHTENFSSKSFIVTEMFKNISEQITYHKNLKEIHISQIAENTSSAPLADLNSETCGDKES